jgi:hypothetical protein
MPRVWWCNQGRCWEGERANSIVCSSAEAQVLKYRRTVGMVRAGDIIVHYVDKHIVAVSQAISNGRRCMVPENISCEYGLGWMFETEYHDLHRPVHRDSINGAILALELPDSPIISTGTVRQAYFIPFDAEGLRVIQEASDEPWPPWATAVLKGERASHEAERGADAFSFEEILANVESSEETSEYFDPQTVRDARERIAASIVYRRGQAGFRRRLLEAYERRCAITGCDVEAVLEAAHIIPYQGKETNHPANGLLLRADLHTLFDLGLITVDPDKLTVVIAPELSGTHYQALDGKPLRLPVGTTNYPSKAALDEHQWKYFLH